MESASCYAVGAYRLPQKRRISRGVAHSLFITLVSLEKALQLSVGLAAIEAAPCTTCRNVYLGPVSK